MKFEHPGTVNYGRMYTIRECRERDNSSERKYVYDLSVVDPEAMFCVQYQAITEEETDCFQRGRSKYSDVFAYCSTPVRRRGRRKRQR
ncbi:hypothetical protein PMAYCL1PPCAC_08473 [Pristionchus mayeri]|uniref:Uncharacterized protein n=1 Tax=Pristionchus mayeri TaxID=1317129 RepID=A0AAN4ZGZ2_9BILA|nr:hypothetical protein PMAYCL1PPCAC_08458 [Pristionchus mayeri]GMR38278.1 hypothetical protein PMAYCL1PPCAC_08473 [Pristionchus mayeri]